MVPLTMYVEAVYATILMHVQSWNLVSWRVLRSGTVYHRRH
ncbi:hypothetical protein T09_8588 [Trichinella sp. T9]|nr:hypothetical protein T09_8588 [Trichinella sp. T9]